MRIAAFEIGENVRCGGRYSALDGGRNSSAPGALTSRYAAARTRHDRAGVNVAEKRGLKSDGPLR